MVDRSGNDFFQCFVGFHDIISVLLSGNVAYVKPSSQDAVLLDFLLGVLKESGSDLIHSIKLIEKLNFSNFTWWIMNANCI